jgi:tripartite ATP-independent transporter DctM subunit
MHEGNLNRPWLFALAQSTRRVDQLLGLVAGAILAADAVLVASTIILRAFFSLSLPWVGELSEISLIWIAFLGAITAFHSVEHVSVGAMLDLWPGSVQPIVRTVGLLFVILVMGILGWEGGHAILRGTGFLVATGWSRLIHYGVFELACIVIVFFACATLLHQAARTVILGILIAALTLCLTWFGFREQLGVLAETAPLIFMTSVFVAALLIGVPLSFTFAGAGVAIIAFSPSLTLRSIPGNMLNTLESFVLVAIPFFILVGGLLSRPGMSRALLSMLDGITRPIKGGAAMTSVIGVYIMSGMSGSKMADIAATAPVVGPLMRARGHTEGETTGLLCAAAAMSESIPPSIALIIISSATSLSTAALFAAGLVPAAVVSLCILALVFIRAHLHGVRATAPAPLRQFLRDAVGALPLLVIPVIIRAGIVGGVATPSEVSSLAAVYSVLMAIFLYRISLREVLAIIIKMARTSGMLLFLLCCVSPVIYVFSVAGISDQFKNWALGFSGNAATFMIGSVVVVIATGMIFEGLPALVVFAPLFLPIAKVLGFHPLQYAVVLVMAMGVGAFAPPLGVGYFATCGLVGISPSRAARDTFVYLSAVLVGIAIVSAFPEITLWLPRAMRINLL